MQVTRSGYYSWTNRPQSQRSQENKALLIQIKSAHKESKKTYGSPRIHQELWASGFHCSRNRIARIMRENGIAAEHKRRFQVTTDSKHDMPVAENLLDQKFDTPAANTRWAGDITYLWTKEGWLYLAVILDLFSRRVVGWSMKSAIDRSLVIGALRAAVWSRRPGTGELICHSDRGSQYASGDYQKILREAGIACSMSRKGNCWDNAPVESFFATLKREMVYRNNFATREEARTAVFSWIEGWYNRKRRHSALGYLSPEQFERQQQHQPMAA